MKQIKDYVLATIAMFLMLFCSVVLVYVSRYYNGTGKIIVVIISLTALIIAHIYMGVAWIIYYNDNNLETRGF